MSHWRLILMVLILPWAVMASREARAQVTFAYQDKDVRAVIQDIEARTAFRFLYRDALITGTRVSFDARGDEVLARLDGALRPGGLALRVDEARHQVLIIKAEAPAPAPTGRITGYVLDDETGSRLPYATVTWHADGVLQGVVANEAGRFQIVVEEGLRQQGTLQVDVSYVGYETERLQIDLSARADLPVRLVPQSWSGQEVVVSGTLLQSNLDTTWHGVIRPGRYEGLGEGNVLRSLSVLPSVTIAPALGQGLNIRGSKADGFQVLLDGVSIYNQHHFFGLFDAFNEDALQTIGLYYSITPAHLQGPPGGTLSFSTRTGSQRRLQASLGVSNVAVKGTVEGPLWGGRGSWLVSGRHSYMDAIGWFNNNALIAQGLDSILLPDVTVTTPAGHGPAVTFPGDQAARFYDLHAKVYHESPTGDRLVVNAYMGGDEVSLNTVRAALVYNPQTEAPVLLRKPVDNQNRWHNEAASLHYQWPVGERAYSQAVFGLSNYGSALQKDDFVSLKPRTQDQHEPPLDEQTRLRKADLTVASFNQYNDLLELKHAQRLDVVLNGQGTLTAGYDLHHYTITYEEASEVRTSFTRRQESFQADLHGQYQGTLGSHLGVLLGVRSHYFSTGDFLRVSPRMQVQLAPQGAVTATLGYSRNHQFLHRLYLENITSADVWIMSREGQPPTLVDQFNLGLHGKMGGAVLQAEVYYKRFENLRQHETIAFKRDLLQDRRIDPWLFDTEGEGRGLELMARHRTGPVAWTHSYTLSRMDVRHDAVNHGQPYRADWDRLHQFRTLAVATLTDGLEAHVRWLYASGVPNTLAFLDPTEPASLDPYHRMDLGLRYQGRGRGRGLEVQVSLFNVYDRANPRYRSPVAHVLRKGMEMKVRLSAQEVYDLGFQPSFSLSYAF